MSRETTGRRLGLLAALVLALVCPPGLAYGNSLTATNREVAAGFEAVATCGTLPNAKVGWTVRANNAVLAAEVSGLPATCDGHNASIVLSGTSGGLPDQNLANQAGVVISGGSAVFSSLSATVSPTSISKTHFVIHGVPRNFLDPATSGFESGTHKWTNWFGTTLSVSSAVARSGTQSLRVDLAGGNWGIQTNNWPGFAATAGARRISFWARLGAGTGLGADLTVQWLDSANTVLQTDSVQVTGLTSTWQQGSADVVAPPGTAAAWVTVTHSAGVSGNHIFLDDFFVGTRN